MTWLSLRVPWLRESLQRRPGPLALGDLLFGVVVAALTAVQGMWMVESKSERWVGNWAATSAALDWATLFGPSIGAAAVAWTVAAPRRYGYAELLRAAARSQGRIYRAGIFAAVAGQIVGYLAVLLFTIAKTGRLATHGHLGVVELLTPASAVVFAIGVGVAAGRVVTPILAPVAAAVVPYATYGFFIYSSIYTNAMVFEDLLTTDLTDRTYLRLPAEILVGRSVFWVAAGVVLIAGLFFARRTAYAAGTVLVLAFSTVAATAGARIDVPTEYAAICFAGTPTVCVDRAHEHVGPEYRERVDSAFAKISGLVTSGVTVVQSEELLSNSLRYTGSSPDVVGTQLVIPLVKRNTAPAHEIDPARFNATFGFSLFVRPCYVRAPGQDTPSGTEDGRRSAVVLYNWWLVTQGLPIDGSAYPGQLNVMSVLADDASLGRAATRYLSLSDAQRAAWMARNGESIFNCRAEGI